MDYMPCIKDHFWRATGLRLNGLRDFTAWIKQGSYYHGLVAQQGHLHKCPHLAGALLPRQPQMTPSESRWESQKQVEMPATSSSESSSELQPPGKPCHSDSCCSDSCHSDSCHSDSCCSGFCCSLQHTCSHGDRRSG